MECMDIGTALRLFIGAVRPTKDPATTKRYDNLFSRLLNRWHSSGTYPAFVEFDLDHQYATDRFQLQDLKGHDFSRALLTKRACAENGNFRVMLVNVEKRLRNMADMNGPGGSAYIYPDYRVKAGANKLIVIKEKHILKLLHHQDVEELDDDEADENQNEQLGGICRPDVRSTMVIARRDGVASYLLPPEGYKNGALHTLLDGITNLSSSDSFLLDVCEYAVRLQGGYHVAGKVAVAACRMKNTRLFNEAESTYGLDERAWACIGLEIDLDKPPILENSIVKALLSSISVYHTYQAIKAFGEGLAKRAAARDEVAAQDQAAKTFERGSESSAATRAAKRHEIAVREGWLTSVLMMALERKMASQNRRDAYAMVEMISGTSSINQFIIYQGVRKHLTKMPRNPRFAARLLHETTLRLPASGLSRIFLQCINQTAQEHHVWENYATAEEMREHNAHTSH